MIIINKKINHLFNRKNFVILFFAILIINYVFFNHRILFRENGYILGDWLVNYNGGFVRRAFLGQIFFYFSKISNLSIINIIFVFSSIIYCISIILFYKILKDKLNNNIVLIMILLPSTLLFNFFDPLTVGRKEILVFFLFFIYYLNLDNKNIFYKIFFYFLFIIFILTHEIVFFQIPYLFLLRYLYLKKNKNIFNFKDYHLEILIFITGSLIILLFFKYSYLYDNQILCSSLSEVKLSTNVCYGTINDLLWKDKEVFLALWGYFNERNYFFNYSLYILLSLFPIIYIYIRIINKKFIKKLFILSLFCFLFSLIFILRVNDWGRYINITIILQLLVFLKFLDFNFGLCNFNFANNKIIKIFLLIIYLTNWHMPHCCNPNIGDGYNDLVYRVKSRILDNTSNSTKFNDKPRLILRKLFNIH